jgi:hypothetical protein
MFNALGGWVLYGALLLGFCDPLDRMARDTWQSIVEMTNDKGLTDDHILVIEGQKTLPRHTSPTNVAMYLFSVTCARNLQIIDQAEAETRLKKTLDTLATLERHHGLFLNWYDPQTGIRITHWNPGGHAVAPFLSSVDNAWLVIGLIHVSETYPNLKAQSDAILKDMNLAFLYNQEVGAFRGGWDVETQTFSRYDYTLLYSETRVVSYAAAKMGQIPKTEMRRLIAAKRSGILLSSYGSLFEALAVPLYVPEMEDKAWAIEHKAYLKRHIQEADDRIWGISYSDDALGIYKEFGIDDLAMYPAHFGKEGVVTPYASFLGLQVNRTESMRNILRLDKRCYGRYGFFGAYNSGTGAISRRVLILEQGLILTAIADDRGKNPTKSMFRDLVTGNELFGVVLDK